MMDLTEHELYLGRNLRPYAETPVARAHPGMTLDLTGGHSEGVRAVPAGRYVVTRVEGTPPGDVDYWGTRAEGAEKGSGL